MSRRQRQQHDAPRQRDQCQRDPPEIPHVAREAHRQRGRPDRGDLESAAGDADEHGLEIAEAKSVDDQRGELPEQ